MVFLQNYHLIVIKIDWNEGESAPKMFSSVGFENVTFELSLQAVFLLADPNWQVHTENNFLQCPSTENTHLGQTEPFHEGSGVNWLFAVF